MDPILSASKASCSEQQAAPTSCETETHSEESSIQIMTLCREEEGVGSKQEGRQLVTGVGGLTGNQNCQRRQIIWADYPFKYRASGRSPV